MTQIAEKPNLSAAKIWFDTEFIEDGKTIDLLSIGLVREDGATYYAEPAEADRSRADAWVSEYVLPHLTGPIKPRAVIAAEIVEFAGPNPEFWAYYADYDWVALCQLYGRMIDLPDGWPAFCRDLQQIRAAVGASLPLQKSVEHHALADALWTKEAWEFLCRSSDALITSQAAEIERLREALERARWYVEAYDTPEHNPEQQAALTAIDAYLTASDAEREPVNPLVAKLGAERDRHVCGYPGPRRDVAELLDKAASALSDLEAENARLRKELGETAHMRNWNLRHYEAEKSMRERAEARLAEALKALDEIAAEWL